MNGPEHYLAAEALLREAANAHGGVHADDLTAGARENYFANTIAAAQAHATLALAAAIALDPSHSRGSLQPAALYNQWRAAADPMLNGAGV